MTNLFTDIKNADWLATMPPKKKKPSVDSSMDEVLKVEAGFSPPVGPIERPTVKLVTQNAGFSYEVLLGSKFKWTRNHDKKFLPNSDKPTAQLRADEFIKFFDEEATKLEIGAYLPNNKGRPPFIMDIVSHLFTRSDATGFKG